ncbi:hypothetical protein [Aquimarina sp. I32.4]|uniref:hypothetical protein n=1 Tax=Aquimarina sp. I32.4 TaxID=2053903 RepID=UPI000CDEEE79|nr:hypothetical protein [Aquimarina sp. I32.4]
MNYKSKTLITCLLLFISTLGIAQVRVGDFSYSSDKFKKLKEKDLKRFTNTETVFVLPAVFPKSSYEHILDQVWDITPYKVVYKDDFTANDLKVDDALASFEFIEIEETTQLGMEKSYSFIFLDFSIIDKVKKKKKENVWWSSRVGAIYFTPDIKMRQQVVMPSAEEEVIVGNLINFKLGYLKNYLQLVNKSLKNKKSIDIYYDHVFPELKNLKDHTLYIDSSLLYGYNALFGLEKKNPELEKLMKEYPYKYEIVEYNTLEEKILNQKEDFYYLMWNQVNYNKIINIVNGKNGNLIYQDHTKMSFNIKPKDFKKISSKINKLN